MANPNQGNPQVSVRLDPDVYDRIEREAKNRDRSRAYVAREYMLDGMEKEGDGEEPEAVPA